MESESHEEAGDEEMESGAAGNESDMDLDLLAESDSDSEESQVTNCLVYMEDIPGGFHCGQSAPQMIYSSHGWQSPPPPPPPPPPPKAAMYPHATD